MSMPRQVSAQRSQQTTWTLNRTRIAYQREWGGIGGRRRQSETSQRPRRYSRGLIAASSVTCRPASDSRRTASGARSASKYTANLTPKVKVLDFIKSGEPILTVERTVFEMWLGLCEVPPRPSPAIVVGRGSVTQERFRQHPALRPSQSCLRLFPPPSIWHRVADERRGEDIVGPWGCYRCPCRHLSPIARPGEGVG